jgi:hypothetical protein
MNIRSLVGVLALAAIPGYLGAQAPPAAAAPTVAKPAAAATATPTAAVGPKSSADADTLATRKTASGLGLKPRTKNGTEVYCKSFAEIGTKVATLNCYTKEQVAELQKRTQSNQDDVSAMQRSSLTEPPSIEPSTRR